MNVGHRFIKSLDKEANFIVDITRIAYLRDWLVIDVENKIGATGIYIQGVFGLFTKTLNRVVCTPF